MINQWTLFWYVRFGNHAAVKTNQGMDYPCVFVSICMLGTGQYNVVDGQPEIVCFRGSRRAVVENGCS